VGGEASAAGFWARSPCDGRRAMSCGGSKRCSTPTTTWGFAVWSVSRCGPWSSAAKQPSKSRPRRGWPAALRPAPIPGAQGSGACSAV